MSTSATIENQKAPPDSLHSLVLRMRELENRIAKLEGKPGGYTCTGCGQQRPGNWYLYTAYNSETHEEVRGLCAICIRGAYARVQGPPWKHNGPYPQNIITQRQFGVKFIVILLWQIIRRSGKVCPAIFYPERGLDMSW